METNYKRYNLEFSLSRIDEILDADSKSYQEVGSIPCRSRLTHTNGFYVNCTAVFVDIRDSSKLPQRHNRPVLAKIYRSFISEVVAIFNGNENCRKVNMQGDCVWAVFDTPGPADIRDVLFNCAQVNSFINILNFKLQKKGYQGFEVGIGVDYGRALMIKVGYKSSTINEVVWMGDVVNQACNLCSRGNKIFDDTIVISTTVYKKLCMTEGQLDKYFHFPNDVRYQDCYHGNVWSRDMNIWLGNQK